MVRLLREVAAGVLCACGFAALVLGLSVLAVLGGPR